VTFELITTGIEFATPLVLLVLIPVAALLVSQWLQPRPAAPVADISPLAVAARRTWRVRLRRLPDVIRAVAIVLLILGVARPREGLALSSLPEEGIDVVAVVDVSTSMNVRVSEDETRLQAARRVLEEFAEGMEGHRLGLVIFQSQALTLSPLTSDIEAIRGRIGQLRPGLVPDGTAIGLGIAEGLTMLEDSVARSRVIVMLTDGENNMGVIHPFQAARMAEALGVRVYTVGLGSPVGVDEIDQPAMTELAEVTGGRYFDARSAEELQEAYSTIATLERSRLGDREFLTWREYGPWLALLAAALLAAEMGLRSTWLRRSP
jgi:Ca-activated chloride channel homolog